jgi:hypothetical protein
MQLNARTHARPGGWGWGCLTPKAKEGNTSKKNEERKKKIAV